MKLKFFGIGLAQSATKNTSTSRSKAQAATEYMVIAAVMLAVSGIIFFYSFIYSQNSLSVSKATEAAETVAAAIDYVYSLGYGTQTVVDIELPKNVLSGSVGEKEVVFTLRSGGRTNEIVAVTHANATGTLPTASGRSQILIKYTDTGVVVG